MFLESSLLLVKYPRRRGASPAPSSEILTTVTSIWLLAKWTASCWCNGTNL